MRAALCLALALVILTGCGIRKPLMKPKDIPAYEAKRERKRQQLEHEREQQETSPQPSIEQQAAPFANPSSAVSGTTEDTQ